MRKKTINLLAVVSITAISLISVSLSSCDKKEETQHHFTNRLIRNLSESKTSSNEYLFLSQLGHDGKNCPGCILFNGRPVHRDCMGYGNYCPAVAVVRLDEVGTALTATTTDTFDLTSEDFFLMPDRSLEFEVDKGVYEYLNIPEQLVWRDSATLQFTFTGLSFTSIPLYYNN